MNIKMLKAALAGLVLSFSGFANAGLITFDDDPALVPWTGGFLSDGFSIPSLTASAGAATNYFNWGQSAYSGNNAMLNYNTLEGIIERDSAFDFIGAYFISNMYGNSSSTTFALNGYDEVGSLIFNNTYTVGAQWTYIEVNWSGIHALGFNPTSPSMENMAMDNLAYNNTNQVPEPSTLVIFALAIMGLASRRFKKN